MHDLASARGDLQRSVRVVLALRQLLIDEARWCLAWGVAALVLRVIGFGSRPALFGGIAGALIAGGLAITRALRTAPDERMIVALLDAEMQCGGLLAASADVPLGDWKPSPKSQDLPRVTWDAKRKVFLLACSAAFVIGALLIPIRSSTAKNRLEIGDDIKRLQGQLDVLKDEKLVPQERAEVLKQALEKLQSTAAGDDPAKAWETLDAVDEAMSKMANDAAEDAVQKGEALTRVEMMASALDGGGLGDAAATEGMREMAAEAARAGGENGELMTGLSPEAKKAIARSAIGGKSSASSPPRRRMGSPRCAASCRRWPRTD